jgi:hypothetical protein
MSITVAELLTMAPYKNKEALAINCPEQNV